MDGVDGVYGVDGGRGSDGAADGAAGDGVEVAAVGAEAAARLGDASARLDEVVVRVAGLRAPSWRGRSAEAFDDALHLARRDLRDAGDALERARSAARRLGST